MKTCSKCKCNKELNCFQKDKTKTDGLFSSCRDCNNKRANLYHNQSFVREKDRARAKIYSKSEERKIAHKIWRDKNKTWYRNYRLQRDFGITESDFQQIFEGQGHRCAICKRDSLVGNNWCVDHEHDTGKIRGILCMNCNAALGGFKDDILILQSAIEYLNKNSN